MTAHVDDGRLTAYLDRELPRDELAELESHLRACLPCRHALGRVKQRIEILRGALATLDRPAPMDQAWQAVLTELGPNARPSAGGRASRAWAPARWTLARAAGLVLLMAAGAAAAVVPGSPVRAWLFGDAAAPTTTTTGTAPAAALAESGSWTRAVDGRVAIDLVLPSGAEVVVVQGGARAGVLGPADARYTSREDGHLAVEAGEGPVRVELPDGVRDATVSVNGGTVLVLADGTVTVSPNDARGTLGADGLRFVVR